MAENTQDFSQERLNGWETISIVPYATIINCFDFQHANTIWQYYNIAHMGGKSRQS